MPIIPVPENPIGYLQSCCEDVARTLTALLRVDVNGAALLPATENYVEALNNLGQAMVALAVWAQPLTGETSE